MPRPRPATLLLLLAMALGPAAWLVLRSGWDGSSGLPRVERGPKPMDVVLVTVDGLGARDLALHDPDHPPPPAVDALASRGLELLAAHAPTTDPTSGLASLLTSRLPLDLDLTTPLIESSAPRPSLLSAFTQAGYRTATFSDGALPALSLGAEVHTHGDRRALADAAAAWLPEEELDPGLALWVHLGPRVGAEPPLQAADALLGTLLEALARTRRAERTLVVLAGSTGRGADTTVPILLRLPRHLVAGEVRVGPCSTLDIAPTLLAFCDLPPLPVAAGQSWFGGKPDALLTGLEFAHPAPVQRRDAAGAPVVGVRGLRGLLTDEPGAYNLTDDPAAVRNLHGTPAGDALAEELGPALEALQARRGG